MKGQRVESHEEFWEAGAGAFMQVTVTGDGERQELWLAADPNGHPHHLGGPPHGAGHVVEEEEDGSITVRPHPPSDPGNSNSILCGECGWHGYIDHGEWKAV